MRTETINVYQFEELSDKAKQKAIEQWRNSPHHEYFWLDEVEESLVKFCEIFNLKPIGWSCGHNTSAHISTGHIDNNILNLSHVRLATYLWNNFKSEIYNDIYVKSWTTDQPVKHRKVKSSLRKDGTYSNTYYKPGFAKDCPLTGYCMDNDILWEIWEFINKPDHRTFEQLINDCIKAWEKAVQDDIEYQDSDEYISEHLIANEYEYTDNGKRY